MKVFWVSNIVLPKIAKEIGDEALPLGGWMVFLADKLSVHPDIELHILFPSDKTLNGTTEDIYFHGFKKKNSILGSEKYIDDTTLQLWG